MPSLILIKLYLIVTKHRDHSRITKGPFSSHKWDWKSSNPIQYQLKSYYWIVLKFGWVMFNLVRIWEFRWGLFLSKQIFSLFKWTNIAKKVCTCQQNSHSIINNWAESKYEIKTIMSGYSLLGGWVRTPFSTNQKFVHSPPPSTKDSLPQVN